MQTDDFMELNENTSEVKKEKKFPFLKKLEIMMEDAKLQDAKKSKMKRVHKKGNSQIAKKMGEEAVEMVIARNKITMKTFWKNRQMFSFITLWRFTCRGFELKDVLEILKRKAQKIINTKY